MPDLNELIKELKMLDEGEYMDKVLSEILDGMQRIAGEITDIAEKNRIYDFKYGSIRVVRATFRFGTGYITNYVLRINGKAIPDKPDLLGYDYYAYGDFNNHGEYIDIEDIEDFANDIEGFIQAFKDYVVKHRNNIEGVRDKIAQISV